MMRARAGTAHLGRQRSRQHRDRAAARL